MTTAGDLCERGFLPRELPPPFYSATFGAIARTPWAPRIPSSSKPVVHNLFRWGALRRQLSIPNPLAFIALSREVELRWTQLQPVLALSPWSLSRPVVAAGRAVDPMKQYRVLLLARAASRVGARYVVRADISRFYHSLYTHTIEWAIHTKASVKSNRALPAAQRQQFWGSVLDQRHRDLQDRQSIGIPVGPDTSLIASELLLARVDEAVARVIQPAGVRYIDDYELYFPSLAAAEQGLAVLQEALTEYELALNAAKTAIRELPNPLEASWGRALRRIVLRRRGRGQRFDIVDLFDAAFELRAQFPDEHVLRFAMGIVRHARCLRTNWPILQSLILQGMTVEPGIIREVLSELVTYSALGYGLKRGAIAETLALIVTRHAPLAHGSEVAWALWAHVQLDIPLDPLELQAIETMDDSVVALVALDAAQRGLTPRPPASTVWQNMMTVNELTDSGWLLAYEAAAKGWLPGGHLAQDLDFTAMRNANVEFYRVLPASTMAAVNLVGPAGVGGMYDVG